MHESLRPGNADSIPDDFYREAVSQIRDYAIFLLDREGVIQTWNEGAFRIKGYTAEEAIGRHFRMFYTPDDRGRRHPEEALASALSNGRFEEENWRVRKDGTRFWANVIITPLYDSDGTQRGFAKVTRDLTARRSQEEKMRTTNRKLERLTTEQEAFVRTISHDLRAPLRAMEMLADYTLRDHAASLPAEAHANLEALQSSARRANALVERLLTFIRAENASSLVRSVDLGAVVANLVEGLRRSESSRQVLTVLPSPGELVVEADPDLTRLALQNLLENAWKFTKENPKAVITVGSTVGEDGKRVIFVKDNGVGFDPRAAPRLFQPFQRLHGTRFEGTGLGLVGAKRAIERQGGRIWAESVPGEGATFFFRLS